MIIKALFILRKGEHTPELLVAWDEYTLDENPEGFTEEARRTMDLVGHNDIVSKAVINLSVHEDDIMDRLVPKGTITARVVGKAEPVGE